MASLIHVTASNSAEMDGWMDEWMDDLCFSVVSTVTAFQSYGADGKMIRKGTQWNLVYLCVQ